MCQFLKLEIYIPKTHLAALTAVLRAADAGHIGRYDSCLSVSPVTSSWRPLAGTAPYSGTQGVVSTEEEIKAEVTIRTSQLKDVLKAIRRVHPYEEPVVNVLPLFAAMQERERILVLADDRWHPAEIPERGLRSLPDNPYDFDFVKDAKDTLTPESISGYRTIVICKSNEICSGNPEPWFEEGVTEVLPSDFVHFMENGGRLVVIHSGFAYAEGLVRGEEKFTRPNRDYMAMTGCEFLTHPPRCAVTYHVTGKNHPLMDGVEDFTERDEHYQLRFLADDAEILMESRSADGKTMPAVWTRTFGAGQLTAIVPGHTLQVWRNPSFQRLLLNALGHLNRFAVKSL